MLGTIITVDKVEWEAQIADANGVTFSPLSYPDSFYEQPSWWQENGMEETFDPFVYCYIIQEKEGSEEGIKNGYFVADIGLTGRMGLVGMGSTNFEKRFLEFEDAARYALNIVFEHFVLSSGQFYGVDAMR